MVAVAENDTFKRDTHAGQGFEQHVHPFSPDDLTGIYNQVPVAERTAERRFAGGRHGRVQFDFFRCETVANQFGPHVAGIDDEQLELPVQLEFVFLPRVADPFHRNNTVTVPGDDRSARKNAEGRHGPRANPSR